MNKEQEQGFFNQIEEVLHTHEETYEFGAWEEFDANRKKKRRKWPIYGWVAAAVVVVCVGFGLLEITKKNELSNDHILTKNNKEQHESKEEIVQPVKDNLIITGDAKKVLKTTQVQRSDLQVAQNSASSQEIQVIAVEKPNQQQENTTTAIIVAEVEKTIEQKVNKYSPVLPGAYDSLVNRNHIIPTSPRKLTYSLVVSPSLSNQKMNIGAGMELSYKLGNRLAVSSGLMYTAINAKSDGKSFVASGGKPQSASLAVSGIELPLGLQYQTNSGFYASAGVSALGLLNDQLEYSFLEEKTVTVSLVNSAGAYEELKVVSERKTEKSIESLNNYMGFFNFSAGKKQAFGNVNLNIGPFVKVPFSSVSTEKIKLLQGGIKISVDF